jgi:hypothetical protein
VAQTAAVQDAFFAATALSAIYVKKNLIDSRFDSDKNDHHQ